MRKFMWMTLILCICLTPSSVWALGADSSYLATVTVNKLNVRDEGSTKAAVISSLSNGQKVKVLDEAYGWLYIQAEDLKGWVAGHYLKKSSVANATRQAASLGNNVRVREGPGTQYSVVSSVNKGNALTILESSDQWHRVRTATGVEGWIINTYVGTASAVQNVKQATNKVTRTLAGKTIVLDPGHGGSDPGAIGTTHDTLEKEINLTTASYLKQELQARGAKVVMSRTKDEEKVSLSDRAALGSTSGADAFVSIHYNSSEKKTSGILTFYYSKTKDQPLSRAIEGRLKDGIGLKSNGIAFGDYHVLRENTAPSVLVELGFLTNAKDEAIVRKDSYQKKAAEAIALGLVDYFK